jgi:LacI family transcriptional regulator
VTPRRPRLRPPRPLRTVRGGATKDGSGLDFPCRRSVLSENVFGTLCGGTVISTIHEVAKLSGVSVSTVSRVFNGYTDVSDRTRQKVLASARKLDYSPSAAARTLVMQRSQLIGVVLFTGHERPDLQHPFFLEVLVGLKHSLGDQGYDLLLFSSERAGSAVGRHSYARQARHHRVDGIVALAVEDTDHSEIQKLVEADTPVVGVDLVVAGSRATYVASDNLGGARLAVKHLHSLGHTRIAHIVGLAHTKPAADRLLGYRAEVHALGLEQRPEYEVQGDFYTESGEAAMRALLALPEPPTAVFAASDLMAVGAVKAVEDTGLRCPDDVAVVGFDDVQLAELVSPALTTIRQDKRGLGAAAARSLVQMIDDPATVPPVWTLPIELVVRESSGAQAGREKEVG